MQGTAVEKFKFFHQEHQNAVDCYDKTFLKSGKTKAAVQNFIKI